MQDLDFQISSDLSFSIHIQNTMTAANRLVGWALRTFRRKVFGKVGCWLAAFLDFSTRQQAVVVNGRILDLSPVISGVPQGTLLGRVHFLLHIADIARGVSPTTTTSSYVDDTRANRSITDIALDCQALQDDLDGIYT